jgi:TM2 domain-containing membrane protein YozV
MEVKQTHALPAILSFFIPGLGQLIKGEVLKAFLIWIIGGLVSFFLFWTIVIPFAIWIWVIYDAYNSNGQ